MKAKRKAPCKLGLHEAECICVNSALLIFKYLGEKLDLHVVQHEMAKPPIFTTSSVIPVLPRFAVELVSDAHTGDVAVFTPFPIPAITLNC